jgi:hypothetical protein
MRVLAMVDRQAKRRCVFRAAHDASVCHRRAVIAEADAASRGEFAQFRQLLTGPALGHAADGQDTHHSGLLGSLLEEHRGSRGSVLGGADR